MARNLISGSSQYINCGNITEINGATKLTYSFWGRRSAAARLLTCSKALDNDNRVGLSPWSDGNIYFVISHGGISYGYGAYAYTNDQWHHYAGVYDGDAVGDPAKCKVYIDTVNQVLTFDGANIPATLDTNTADFNIGLLSSSASYAYGDMAELRIWNASLTANEIKTDATGLIPRMESLIGYWRLGVGSPEPDWSGKGYNGALNNAPAIADHAPARNPYAYNIGLPVFLVSVQNVPIFTLIIDKLKDLINTYMTQANGFSLDYGSIDEHDPGSRTYPSVKLVYPEAESLEDEYQVHDRFTEQAEITIKVSAATTADLDKTAHWIVADFGFLFQSFRKTLKAEGLLDYKYIGAEIVFTKIAAYPVDINIKYSLKYRRIGHDLYVVDPTATPEAFSGSAFDSNNKPIILNIMDELETLIGNMTVANGYNFDYGSIDEFDPDSRTYPAVFLQWNEEEDAEDEESMAGYYEVIARLFIRVMSETSADSDKTMYLVRSDFDKLFYDNTEALRVKGLRESRPAGSTNRFGSISAYPTTILLSYLLHHRRRKDSPYST